MKTNTLIVEFAEKYGIKEAVILSEMCKRVFVSDKKKMTFTVSNLVDYAPYLSEKQVWLCMKKLLEEGCVKLAKNNAKGFTRTQEYTLVDTVYKHYMNMLVSDKAFLLNTKYGDTI